MSAIYRFKDRYWMINHKPMLSYLAISWSLDGTLTKDCLDCGFCFSFENVGSLKEEEKDEEKRGGGHHGGLLLYSCTLNSYTFISLCEPVVPRPTMYLLGFFRVLIDFTIFLNSSLKMIHAYILGLRPSLLKRVECFD